MSVRKHRSGESTVALVRSPRPDAAQITDAEVRELVRDAVQLAGGLSDIVQQSCPLGQLGVESQFRSHDRTEIGHFAGMLQQVLPV